MIESMNRVKKFFNLNVFASFAVLFLASICLTLFILVVVQPNSLTQTTIVALILESNGIIFLYNWLPVLFIMLAMFFATSNLSLSCGLVGFFFMLLSTVNRFMIEMRHAPLRPIDLMLGMEFIGIAHSIPISIYITVFSALFVYLIVLVLAVKFIKNSKIPAHARAIGTGASFGALILLFIFIYGDTERYESLPMVGSPFNAVQTYQSRGFIYSFIHAMHHSRIRQPVNFAYFRPQIEELEAVPLAFSDEQRPHIIMILSEAFSDIPLSPAINFDGLPHPMEHFLRISEESITGHIIVPNIGGGTADTEFDILTGLNSRQFRGVPYAFTAVTRYMPGITSALNAVGYRSIAMHPGAGWFYNRQNVYLYLGFEAFLDNSVFDSTQLRGGYISEEHTIDRFLEEIRLHLDNEESPLFFKGITIQNHGPYAGKYGDVAINFNANVPISEPYILAQYLYGMFDVDYGLHRLVEYFRAESAPIILVYYGDHLPSFPLSLYQTLIPETHHELIRNVRLPFLIWANDAARPLLNFELLDRFENLMFDISSFYLGNLLLDMLNISSSFSDFTNELMLEYPIVLESVFFDSAGEMHIFDPATHRALNMYENWSYFRITN
ncbi:MAG: LTA synthase family protein [Turicibacter sp.]|nr:LTA synthase family protein [Turicibacter sp.]